MLIWHTKCIFEINIYILYFIDIYTSTHILTHVNLGKLKTYALEYNMLLHPKIQTNQLYSINFILCKVAIRDILHYNRNQNSIIHRHTNQTHTRFE